MSLNLKTITIDNIEDKEDIKAALIALAGDDGDLLGYNGEEYLRDDAKKAGYNNNADFYADKAIKSLPDYVYGSHNKLSEAIKQFVYDWMESDQYYVDYRVETCLIEQSIDPDNNVGMYISLAYIDEA